MNKAAELGPKTYPWWKDWRDATGLIVASGPSTSELELSKLKGKVRCLAIKENYNICKWADVVYGCDSHWWIYRRGLPEFSGLKLCYECPPEFPGPIKIQIEKVSSDILTETPGVIGNGYNSGFQALNLLVQFGCSRIILMGFDFHDRGGNHWYGRNNWPGANNPSELNFPRWLKVLERAKRTLDKLEVDVINSSRLTAIKTFRVRSVSQIIDDWDLHETRNVAV